MKKGRVEGILEFASKAGTLMVFGSVAVGSLGMAAFFCKAVDWMHVFENDIFTPIAVKFTEASVMTGLSLGFVGLAFVLGITGLNAALNGWD